VANLQPGPQSIGNELSFNGQPSVNFAGDIAHWFLQLPAHGSRYSDRYDRPCEPGIGDVLPAGAQQTFQEKLDAFRQQAGITTPGGYYAIANNGQSYRLGDRGERSLDVGIVASASPGSAMGLHAGSGYGNHATANAVTAYQAAFWDQLNGPAVVSSSFGIFQQSSPDSPFTSVIRELLRLRRRSRIRSHDRSRHAQRHAAGALLDGDRTPSGIVRISLARSTASSLVTPATPRRLRRELIRRPSVVRPSPGRATATTRNRSLSAWTQAT
jgi:hypothetical protein